jgi:hypothetical protein
MLRLHSHVGFDNQLERRSPDAFFPAKNPQAGGWLKVFSLPILSRFVCD